MRKVFADTLYWVAIARPNDSYSSAAKEARVAIGPCLIVTTEEVLSEFVTALAGGGPTLRKRVVEIVREILGGASVRLVTQSHDSFLRALDRFVRRPDKEYSLTDCSSMNAMDAEGIRDILTHGHHFEQEGFNVLIHSASCERPG